MKDYAKHIYDILKSETEGIDSVYEDYIIAVVGLHGLASLIKHDMIETCGVINGRQLYVLC